MRFDRQFSFIGFFQVPEDGGLGLIRDQCGLGEGFGCEFWVGEVENLTLGVPGGEDAIGAGEVVNAGVAAVVGHHAA